MVGAARMKRVAGLIFFGRSVVLQGQRGVQAIVAWPPTDGRSAELVPARWRRRGMVGASARRQRLRLRIQRAALPSVYDREDGVRFETRSSMMSMQIALCSRLEPSGELLDQHERGLLIVFTGGRSRRRPRGIERAVALERRGVVDQAAERPEGLRAVVGMSRSI